MKGIVWPLTLALAAIAAPAMAQSNCRNHYDVRTGKVYSACKQRNPYHAPDPHDAKMAAQCAEMQRNYDYCLGGIRGSIAGADKGYDDHPTEKRQIERTMESPEDAC